MSEAYKPCGECDECCTALWVEEMDSPAGQACVHQRPGVGGCGIYTSPERPRVCGAFACMWARNAPGVPHRPDECGVLAWRDSPSGITLRELVPGALDAPWVAGALERWTENLVCLERLCPPGMHAPTYTD